MEIINKRIAPPSPTGSARVWKGSLTRRIATIQNILQTSAEQDGLETRDSNDGHHDERTEKKDDAGHQGHFQAGGNRYKGTLA